MKHYLAEFDFRYNERCALDVEDEDRTVNAIKGIGGKRPTYRRTGEGPSQSCPAGLGIPSRLWGPLSEDETGGQSKTGVPGGRIRSLVLDLALGTDRQGAPPTKLGRDAFETHGVSTPPRDSVTISHRLLKANCRKPKRSNI